MQALLQALLQAVNGLDVRFATTHTPPSFFFLPPGHKIKFWRAAPHLSQDDNLFYSFL